MISFGDLKNNFQQLKKYLNRMGFFSSTECTISARDFDDTTLRRRNNQLFLLLINYILLSYSYDLCKKILEKEPKIRVMKDKPFVEKVLMLCRSMLEMDVRLTADHFLSEKYFQKKVELLAIMSKKVYEEEQSRQKIDEWDKIKKKARVKAGENPPAEQWEAEDDEEEQIRTIDIIPQHQQYSPVEEEQQCCKFPSPVTQNPPVRVIKQGKQEKRQKFEAWDEDLGNKNEEANLETFHKNNVPSNNAGQTGQKVDGISRSQYEQILLLIRTLHQSVTSVSDKFQLFQTNVKRQMNNINAKVTLLEANVQMIKDNL